MRELYLGNYRLLNLLANGHTTHVWEAIHDASSRRVAIKRLKAEKPKRAELGLLRHEYAVAKTFNHHRVVKALRRRDEDGRIYDMTRAFIEELL